MRAKYFERELVHEFDDNGDVVRYVRMTFTADELRAVSVMLAAGAGAVGYGFTANTIRDEFWDAWNQARHGGGISVPK